MKLKITVFAICSLSLLLSAACQSSKQSSDEGNIVVVNAPATGKVKRIDVAEGVHVERGTPLVEIAVESEPVAVVSPTPAGAEAKAIQQYDTVDELIENARAQVVHQEAEVARLTPLVNSGEAPQAQLDDARALYEKAQRTLTKLQEAKRNAETALLAARQPNQSQGPNAPTPREQIVSAVAVSPGKVAVISVRVGDLVKLGQPLATIREE